ncbi:MAG: protease complex subunit PrcB family protein [Trueperaceae bacterium]|nr:protease complex subunit PrcB family protein [Trueperaceae bacterium]
MRTRALLVSIVLGLVLASCEPEPSRSLSDVYLYGYLDTRLTYFYGGEGEFDYAGRTVQLSVVEATDRRFNANFAVSSAALVDGSPFLREGQTPLGYEPVTLSRIPLTTDMQVRVNDPVGHVVYFDGTTYLSIIDRSTQELDVRVVPTPRFNRLRGLGELTNHEADALANALEAMRRPFALVELPRDVVPQRAVDGLDEHRRSAFYIQLDIPTDAGAFVPPPSQLIWETVASGNQATSIREARYQMIQTRDQLISLWAAAHSAQLQQPALPEVFLERETIVGIFLGQRSSGGYSVSVVDVVEERGDLYIDVRLTVPGRGDFTTQALTSPWTLVKVLRAGYQVAWIRDADTGDLIGAARPQ